MVFFTCDGCGEALKKNQVQKHTYQCRSHSFSCHDCQKVFDRETYQEHTKCISENEKYGGANYVSKEYKGEVKQSSWLELVSQAIANVKDSKLKAVLEHIEGQENIPRKEKKFINFLMNSSKVKSADLATRAWRAISDEAERLKGNNSGSTPTTTTTVEAADGADLAHNDKKAMKRRKVFADDDDYGDAGEGTEGNGTASLAQNGEEQEEGESKHAAKRKSKKKRRRVEEGPASSD